MFKKNDKSLKEFLEISNNALFGKPYPSKEYLKELSPVNYIISNLA